MEKKLVGRKLLRVLLFCFISISVFGNTENALRNDLPLLLSSFDLSASSRQRSFDKLSYRSSDDMSGFDLSINSRQRSFDKLSYRSSDVTTSCLFEQGNGLAPEVIALYRICRKSFLLNFAFSGKVQLPSQTYTSLTSLPLIGLALGYFILDLNTSITQSV